jgi:hypothetical protein
MWTNPNAYDPRPPEKIDPEKWVHDGLTRCPKCGSDSYRIHDVGLDPETCQDNALLECHKCDHRFRVSVEAAWKNIERRG